MGADGDDLSCPGSRVVARKSEEGGASMRIRELLRIYCRLFYQPPRD